jgi:pyruvate carboxylase
VPVLPGTEEPVTDRDEALKIARESAFPLIIKAAFGGGGRGMRVVNKAADLAGCWTRRRARPAAAFGNPAVFLEKYIPRAKHIEVQILGDQHGNVIHLHERDCSVQRRHQKVIEVAPSFGLPGSYRARTLRCRRRMAREIRYDNAGTIEFLVRPRPPRVVLHRDEPAHPGGAHRHRGHHRHRPGARADSDRPGPRIARPGGVRMPPQDQVPRNGYAIQCRITTEDPENKFMPDYGKISPTARPAASASGSTAAWAYGGAVITPFYDSLLVKVSPPGRTASTWRCQRMDRALAGIPHPRRQDQHSLPRKRHQQPDFRRAARPRAGRHHAGAVSLQAARRDRATKLLNFLGNVIVNGNPHAKGYRRPAAHARAPRPCRRLRPRPRRPPGTRELLLELGPEGSPSGRSQQKRLLITDTTFRDAHQSLLATRVRTYDMLAIAGASPTPAGGCSAWKCGAARPSTPPCASCTKTRGNACASCARAIPNICFQMLLPRRERRRLHQLSRQRRRRLRPHAAAPGIDIFRIFDSLNYCRT